ncbi:uncharacterized protein LOC121853788 isoform X2 [Homarus americanus]|uniref:uncharacterized protein LOC121853788 isoform X2 n=1 Tax=Homarus americanus TaxID=6706 RepID=UPI001C457C92|nr:uncharacterized protein LOC121853788 isoform X2 [Homarus americanus]
MKTFFFYAAVLVVCMRVGWAAEALQQKRQLSADDEASDRLLFGTGSLALGGGTGGTYSVTIGNAGYIALGAALLVPLIIGLALLFYLLGGPRDDYSASGYGSGTYGSSTYARSVDKSFDPYAIDWEKFSILDWIAIGEEAWRKFDPSDLECQKRLICEVHQNTSRFGNPAARIVDLFSYLQYAEVLSLPDEFKALIEEYNDAADRGRSLQKDCGEVYTTCDFSVKKIMDKYSHNEV